MKQEEELEDKDNIIHNVGRLVALPIVIAEAIVLFVTGGLATPIQKRLGNLSVSVPTQDKDVDKYNVHKRPHAKPSRWKLKLFVGDWKCSNCGYWDGHRQRDV